MGEVYILSGCPSVSLNAYKCFLWSEHGKEISRMEDLGIDRKVMLT